MFNKTLKSILIISVFILLISFLAVAQEQNRNAPIYENKELGIKIIGPTGWFTSEETPLVTFSPSPFTSATECSISLMAGALSLTKFKTPLEIANASIQSLQTMLKDFKIIKEPTVVILSNQEGANFIYESGKDINIEDRRL